MKKDQSKLHLIGNKMVKSSIVEDKTMPEKQEIQEWYGRNARVMHGDSDCLVERYECQGKGLIVTYKVFEGMEMVFMEFNSEDSFIPVTPYSEILEISCCRRGRVVCEFSDNICAHLSEDDFWIGSGGYLPTSYYFPFGYFDAVTLVIDEKKMSLSTKKILADFSIDIKAIGKNLALNTSWYIGKMPCKLQRLFDEIYEAKGKESTCYFAIKTLELLFQIQNVERSDAEGEQYYPKEQIEAVKEIWNYLIAHLDEERSLKQLVKEKNMGTTMFQRIFYHVYGDSPYAFLKKYKMGIAKKMILDGEMKIGEIAFSLGYSNASKLSAAFKDVFGILPKDYRKLRS